MSCLVGMVGGFYVDGFFLGGGRATEDFVVIIRGVGFSSWFGGVF